MNQRILLECVSGAIDRPPHPSCRAVIVVPAKDEELSLRGTLDALRDQYDLQGRALSHDLYELLLLLNNCSDDSAAVATRYAKRHPSFRMHVLECQLPSQQAHVGTARQVLMDLACDRLETLGDATAKAILSTDADTQVASDWITQNVSALEAGADAVGGVIHLFAADLDLLDAGTRLAYDRDRSLQAKVAKLESLLDPDEADPWPRHLEHFGASLACTPEIYRRCGGLPAVKRLEDVAFVNALRRIGARIRHAPDVHITTSARLDGRAEVGLSGQLRIWQRESNEGVPHLVDSAAWFEHRFRMMGALRSCNKLGYALESVNPLPSHWTDRLRLTLERRLPTEQFLNLLDCDSLIEQTFAERTDRPSRHQEITAVLAQLDDTIRRLEDASVLSIR